MTSVVTSLLVYLLVPSSEHPQCRHRLTTSVDGGGNEKGIFRGVPRSHVELADSTVRVVGGVVGGGGKLHCEKPRFCDNGFLE